MKETLLYKKLKDNQARCFTCQRNCLISQNQWGYCQTRINKKGKLFSVIYGVVSSVNVDPIEKKPVFHYQPGSPCLSLGTYGCNFRCQFCQNWQISYSHGASLNIDQEKYLSPQEAIKIAKNSKVSGIAWTYNEPAIWLEYSLDCAKLAKKAGLYTVWVTNGYGSKAAIDTVAPYLDIYRVDLKSTQDNFYRKLINVPLAKGVFKVTKYVHDRYPRIHIECITNLVPGWNDSCQNLKKTASWIVKNLGAKTPWHITRFFPSADLTNVPPTPLKTLIYAQKIGQKQGLQFVYLGNLATETGENTYCPKCKILAIKRSSYSIEMLSVDKKGHCQKCGEDLNTKLT